MAFAHFYPFIINKRKNRHIISIQNPYKSGRFFTGLFC